MPKWRTPNAAPAGERPDERRRMWSAPVLTKYWALQLPATVIVLIVVLFVADGLEWPRWAVWAIVAAWVAKDAALYPLVWRSYDPGYPTALPYEMEGARGKAVDTIDPSGLVRVAGELWQAEAVPGAPRIEKGETVRIAGQRGLKLLVEPVDHAPAERRDG